MDVSQFSLDISQAYSKLTQDKWQKFLMLIRVLNIIQVMQTTCSKKTLSKQD